MNIQSLGNRETAPWRLDQSQGVLHLEGLATKATLQPSVERESEVVAQDHVIRGYIFDVLLSTYLESRGVLLSFSY